MKTFKFDVEAIESGQRRPYGDSYYSYNVTSDEPEYIVQLFCTKVLKSSYIKKDMPNPFAGELLQFEKITNNNKNKGAFDDTKPETYSYKVRCEYTG